MTDERLHEMMADPGPAPTHDANGWPTDVASPARGDCADSLFEDCVDGGGGTVYRVECPHGRWLERVRAGRALYRANRWHGFADTTNPPTAYHAPDMPAESPAGPASSSASPSGTGGLAGLLARLQAEVQSLAGMAQVAADVVEGRRRELWDAVVQWTHLAAVRSADPNSAPAINAATLQYAYGVIAGIDGPELQRLLTAELDARYGADRAKGGEPRD
jgi:hypothetical protein